jgi:vacuolar protein sorting-associated protein 29
MAEIVLIVGDSFVPQRVYDISEQFKSLLTPNKINHILCLGNMGSKDQYDWLKTLSNNFHCVKGDYDFDESLPEKKCVQIGEFKIGMIHGHQVFPTGDIDSLASVQRELGCDLLAYGYDHELSIKAKDNALYLNPGSISGAFSPSIRDSIPSFIIIALQGDIAVIYVYILKDESQKFEVKKYEYKIQDNEYKEIENDDDEENI